MANEKILTQVTGQGPGAFPLVNVVIKWVLSQPVGPVSGSEVFFSVDLSTAIGDIRESLRDQLADHVTALVANVTGQTFTADDIFSLDDLLEQSHGIVPLTVVMSSIAVLDTIERVLMPSILGFSVITINVVPWSVSVKNLVVGIATLTVKNDAGTLLGSASITGPGSFTFTPTVPTIDAGDSLHFGFSSIGTAGLAGVSVTAWLKVPLGL